MRRYDLDRVSQTRGRGPIDWAAELNPQQLAAVTAPDGPHLVIAGAGSGKTRTLVYRVAYLVDRGVHPRSILLLTFTNRAAREMLRRATTLLDGRCAEVAGGTFHAFANRVLRKYAEELGYASSYTILDASDSEDLLGRLRAALGLAERKRRFPKKDTIQRVLSKAVNTGQTIEQVVLTDYAHYAKDLPDLEHLAEVYTEAKRERALADFDDLLVLLRTLLLEHPTVRAELSDTYQHVLVDEYQDTNRLQAEIACLLAVSHGRIMVVGDDAQSIYRFRGAEVRNILDFPKVFPNCATTTLEQNYRSTQPILALTNAIIAQAREGYPKRLFSATEGVQRPVYLRPADEHEQSLFVCNRILELREQGVPLHQMAVLTRAMYYSNDLQIELARHNIPFVPYGGRRFLEAAHVKDVLAHLRLSQNPYDELAWDRALQLLEGIGPRIADAIIAVAVGERQGLDALTAAAFGGRAYTHGLQSLHALLEEVSAAGLGSATALDRVLGYYAPLFARAYDDHPVRQPDLEAMLAIAERYDGVEAFLTDLTLEPHERDELAGEGDEEERPLALSTIHSAKGLEWHTVFLIHLLSGCLPITYDPEEMEEERRLLYVAATRAERELYLLAPMTLARNRPFTRPDGGALAQPSEFLRELHDFEALTERWALGPARGATARGDPGARTDAPPDAGGDERLRNILDYFGR